MRVLPVLIALCACGPATGVPRSSGDAVVAHATRASVALRSVRPSPEELARVRADPGALPALVQAWLEDPRFLDTVRDLHAETWWLRSDTAADPPAAGPLGGVGTVHIEAAFQEEALQLVADIVARDEPYTRIVTADHTVVDPVLAAAYGLPHDPDGPTWQRVRYDDGRPTAGVLSTNGLWLRHISGVANAHRTRAAWVTRSLLCDDLGARDLPITGIPHEESDALRDDAACQGCHQALDPVAAQFFGFAFAIRPGDIRRAHMADCEGEAAAACYPLDLYDPGLTWDWEPRGMPGPGFYGLEADHLGELGRQIAADPRFTTCAAGHFWSYLTQADPYAPAPPLVDDLASGFAASGHDVRALATSIVLSSAFAEAPPQVMRPEQLERWIADLTGFVWTAGSDDCDGAGLCSGTRPMLSTDELGVRTLTGGQDGWDVVTSVHAPTPTQQLAVSTVAELAAAHVVAHDLARPPSERRLLSSLPAGDPAAAARPQLAALVTRILGADDPDTVDQLVPIWSDALEASGPERAWELVIALLLQDPTAWVY